MTAGCRSIIKKILSHSQITWPLDPKPLPLALQILQKSDYHHLCRSIPSTQQSQPKLYDLKIENHPYMQICLIISTKQTLAHIQIPYQFPANASLMHVMKPQSMH